MSSRASAIVTLLAVGVGASAMVCAGPDSVSVPKAVLSGNQLFAVISHGGESAHAILLVTAVGPDSYSGVRRLDLPVAVHTHYPVAWDIVGDHVVAISVHEFAPRQRAIQLIRTPLDELKPVGDAEDGPRGLHQLNDLVAVAEPLATAIIESEVRETGPVSFDLVARDDGTIRLLILADGELSIWTLGGDEWQKLSSFDLDASGPLRAMVCGTELYIRLGAGEFRLVGDAGLSPVAGSGALGNVLLFLDDRDGGQSLILVAGERNDGTADFARTVTLDGGRVATGVIGGELQRALVVLEAELGGK